MEPTNTEGNDAEHKTITMTDSLRRLPAASSADAIFRSCVFHEELMRRAMAMSPCELTRTQMSIMTTLNAVGPLAMTPLSECIAVSKEQVSRAVKPLIAQELIERRRSETNRRVVTVCLTGKGSLFLHDLMVRNMSSFEDLLSPLSAEEREELVHLCHESDRLIGKALEPKHNPYSA